jgi:putative membrane protein
MTQAEDRTSLAGLATRGSLGGVLMGLANLVPGISGGTMLLAAGVYTRFIEAIAEVTTFRFRLRSIVLLVVVAAAALAAIVLLAGPVKHLVATRRWVMYSVFIGLTLGGVPMVWRMARPAKPALYGGTAVGFLVMALMALTQAHGAAGGQWVLLLVAGIAGASAMILPGVSGAYLLLVLGQYETILGAVDRLKGGDVSGSLGVLVPVAVGVVVGIVGVSNLIRWTLHRYEQATLGVLLGLLFGSVLGIYPFQEFDPAARHVAGALGLIAAGYLLTVLIDRVSRAAA